MVTRLYYSNREGYYKVNPTGLPKNLDTTFRWLFNHLPALTPNKVIANSAPTYFVQSDLLPGTFTPPTSQAHLMFSTAALAAGSISGTVKGQMRVIENSSLYDDMSEMWIFLVDSNWAYKSTLLDGNGLSAVASEWNGASGVNRKMPYGGAVALTSQTAADGDRLVVVIGAKRFTNYGNIFGDYYHLFSTSASDLPEDETTTTDLQPWLEFSQTLSFLPVDPHPAPSATTALPQVELVSPYPDMTYPPGTLAVGDDTGGGGGGAPVVPTTGQTWPRRG